MYQQQQSSAMEDSVTEVMRTLPPILRDYLLRGKYTPVTRNLMFKYQLRIDQGGILEREIMLLLMGVEDPGDFADSLAQDAMLDPATISGITKDVNEQIFIPLREEMRRASTQQPAPRPASVPVPNYAAAPQPPAPAQAPMPAQRPYVPPPPPPPPQPQPQQFVPQPPPERPMMPPPPQAPQMPPPQQQVVPPPPPPPARPTTPPIGWQPRQEARVVSELPKGTFAPPLQSPRYPGQENIDNYIRQVAPPQQINKIPVPAVRPQVVSAAPATALPNAPVESAPAMPPAPEPQTPPMPRVVSPVPPLKSYLEDPYREPLDEESARQ